MDPIELANLLSQFPRLSRFNFSETSEKTPRYNCIAWAASHEDINYWPGAYGWPQGVPEEVNLAAFIKFFESFGYSQCIHGGKEDGFEKVALYAKPSGEPTHAARQLANGRWTSKLGKSVDIEHDMDALDDSRPYGSVVAFMKRPVR